MKSGPYEVWAFGSRTKFRAEPYSDLDLTIISDTPVPLKLLARMADDFSDSDLPWRVDLVDWATTTGIPADHRSGQSGVAGRNR